MKFFSYILTILILAVNVHFTKAYPLEMYIGKIPSECTTKCCPNESSSEPSDTSEKPNCCSDAYCVSTVSSAYAINYAYTPEIPENTSVTEFLPLVYTYTNLYTSSHVNDFWNPPKI